MPHASCSSTGCAMTHGKTSQVHGWTLLRRSLLWRARTRVSEDSTGSGNLLSGRAAIPSASRNYIGHNYMGHNYIGHNYTGHNYSGHNYIGTSMRCSLMARSSTYGRWARSRKLAQILKHRRRRRHRPGMPQRRPPPTSQHLLWARLGKIMPCQRRPIELPGHARA